MRPARSLLFVPGNRQRHMEKAPTLPADALMVDLEDSVPLAEKASARATVREYIPSISGKRIWVRVNGPSSGLLEADLEGLIGVKGLDGVMVPKPDSAAEIQQIDAVITKLEKDRGLPEGQIEVIVAIESARGVLLAYELATASKRVASLCFSGARDGDLMTDMGYAWSPEGVESMHARQHVLLCCRAAGIDYPLDGVYADVTDDDGFVRDTELSFRLGYRGRTVIHPKQIERANAIYRPSAEQVAYYRRVLAAFQEAEARGEATTTVDGKMIDYAMGLAARRVIALADAFGAG